MDLCLASLPEKKVKFGGIAVALPAQTIFSWATFLNGREMNLNFVSVLLKVELLELLWEVGWPWWQPLADLWQYPGLTHHIEPRAHHRHIAAIPRCFTAGAKIGQNQTFLRRKEGRVEHFFSSGAAAFFNLFFFIFGRLLSLSLTYVLIGKNIKI